jgi:hypothetical protein
LPVVGIGSDEELLTDAWVFGLYSVKPVGDVFEVVEVFARSTLRVNGYVAHDRSLL